METNVISWFRCPYSKNMNKSLGMNSARFPLVMNEFQGQTQRHLAADGDTALLII